MEVGCPGLSGQSIQWYKDEGYEYLITSSFIDQIHLADKKQDTERQVICASLDQEMELIQEFKPYKNNTEPSFIFDEIYGPAISL